MNVLILTPDRVGSTLLQRLLTIYMLRREFDRPVINLHELSNGLIRYYNETLQQEVLGKPQGVEWGYFQTLPEVIELLNSVDHYKTSRLAHYHLLNRQDSIDDQIKFYEYLNRNFFIISCRRENLFEHALSWVIQGHSKKLNVYSVQEKIADFRDIYKNGITVEQITFEKYLDRYVKYLDWVERYFNVQSYFDYDTHMKDIESYILTLDFMRGNHHNTWQDMFGQDFKSWNACHRMLPNLVLHNRPSDKFVETISIPSREITAENWQQVRGPDWPENYLQIDNPQVPVLVQQEIKSMFDIKTVPVTAEESVFLKNNLEPYRNTVQQIEQLRQDGFLVSGVPLKLQSLQEKQHIVRNYDQCLEWYNHWVQRTGHGKSYQTEALQALAQQEELDLNRPMVQQLVQVTNKLLSSN